MPMIGFLPIPAGEDPLAGFPSDGLVALYKCDERQYTPPPTLPTPLRTRGMVTSTTRPVTTTTTTTTSVATTTVSSRSNTPEDYCHIPSCFID